MQKAKYSPDCVGHFGLSEEQYCHFTSPIRRYPDLVVHRIIKDFLNGVSDLEQKYGQFVVDASVQSSEKEKNATEAERAVDDFYKILYISNYEGEDFDAVVSGVTNFGIFAELSNGVEGLICIETLRGKRYELDRERYVLSNGKYTYRLGQPIKIKVAGVNIMDRRAEFVLTE
jgi:ribonuclease R